MVSEPRNQPVRPFAVLFDYDGTLVDTEPYWIQAEIDLINSLGAPWTFEDARKLCGTTREYTIEVHFAHMAAHGVDVESLDADDFYDRLCQKVIEEVTQQGLPWLPGARELLTDLKANRIPAAIVSNSPPQVLAAGLSQFPSGTIRAVVDSDMVTQGKPDPEGYQLAASRLGVAPEDCMVIEDTRSGLQAGLAAGAVVAMVPGQFPVPDAPGQVKLEGLEGVNLARLRELYAQVRAA